MNRYTNTGHSYSHHTTSSYSSRPPSRPSSEELCDIHVYRVPHELWRDSFNNILNNAITETISMGIIRVPYELRLVDLREEIVQQLQLDDLLPRDFVFLRSVGRSLTTLRGKQEFQLKAKHFIPPVAYSPELYILEVTPEIRDALAISDRFSQSPQSRRASPNTQRGYNNSYRNGYNGGGDTDRGSHATRQPPASPSSYSVNKYEPLPHISDHAPSSHEVNSNSNSNFHPSHSHSQHHQNQDPSSSSSYQNQNQNTYAPYRDKPDNLTYRKDYNYDTHAPPPQAHASHPQPQQQQPPRDRQTDNERNDRGYGQQPSSSPDVAKSDLPRSSDKGGNSRRLDDDSGVGELSRSPDDEYNNRRGGGGGREDRDYNRRMPHHLDSSTFALEDLSESERRRRLEDIENQNEMDKNRWNNDQDERRRQAEEDRRRAEEGKRHDEDFRRNEEQDKLEKEREERRRKEEEEEKDRREREHRNALEKEEERRRKEEEENQGNNYKDDVARFPSPPPLQMSSPEPDTQQQDSAELRQQRKEERDRLLQELEQVRADRQMQEKEREECVKKAKTMQHKTTNRRNEARDMWKKKYFEEKKKTAPLEENSNRLRQELEALHRRLMNTLEGPKDKGLRSVDAKPSEKNNYVIQCTKIQHEIEDIQRRVENAKMKLTAEMKLRNQAEGELRALRAELTQKTTNMTMARQQQYAAMNPRFKEPIASQNQNHQKHDRSHVSDTSAYQSSDSSRILRAF